MNWLSASHASAAAIFPSSLAPSLDCEDIDYFNDKHIYFENQIAANNRLLMKFESNCEINNCELTPRRDNDRHAGIQDTGDSWL